MAELDALVHAAGGRLRDRPKSAAHRGDPRPRSARPTELKAARKLRRGRAGQAAGARGAAAAARVGRRRPRRQDQGARTQLYSGTVGTRRSSRACRPRSSTSRISLGHVEDETIDVIGQTDDLRASRPPRRASSPRSRSAGDDQATCARGQPADRRPDGARAEAAGRDAEIAGPTWPVRRAAPHPARRRGRADRSQHLPGLSHHAADFGSPEGTTGADCLLFVVRPNSLRGALTRVLDTPTVLPRICATWRVDFACHERVHQAEETLKRHDVVSGLVSSPGGARARPLGLRRRRRPTAAPDQAGRRRATSRRRPRPRRPPLPPPAPQPAPPRRPPAARRPRGRSAPAAAGCRAPRPAAAPYRRGRTTGAADPGRWRDLRRDGPAAGAAATKPAAAGASPAAGAAPAGARRPEHDQDRLVAAAHRL